MSCFESYANLGYFYDPDWITCPLKLTLENDIVILRDGTEIVGKGEIYKDIDKGWGYKVRFLDSYQNKTFNFGEVFIVDPLAKNLL